MDEDIKALLVKYITGNANPNERRQVRHWLDQSQDNMDEFASLRSAWDDAVHHPGQQLVDTNAAFDRLRNKLAPQQAITPVPAPPRSLFNIRNIAVAASIMILAATAGLLYKTNQPHPLAQTALDLHVPNGKMKRLILPDSTEVWLNAGTHFSYAASFGEHSREVNLEGEAYFAVRHIDNNPFIVKANGYTVRDIGTTFTITAYPGNKHFKTAVMEGEVEVTMANDQKANLTKNEVLNIDGQTHKQESVPKHIPSTEISSNPAPEAQISTAMTMDEFTGWKDHLLVFDEETFDEVARRLERTFDVNIRITNTQLAGLRYTGRFNKVENIMEALRIIRTTTPIVYHLQKDTIIISADKN